MSTLIIQSFSNPLKGIRVSTTISYFSKLVNEHLVTDNWGYVCTGDFKIVKNYRSINDF